MSTASLSIATLPRINANALRNLLRSPSADSVAVVDVRDSDHVGGHIASSMHVPSSTLDYKVPELVRTLKDKKTVVFHCMLSQQRGPSAALRYARERERLLGAEGGVVQDEGASGRLGQRVVVLTGGFNAWQEQSVSDRRFFGSDAC